MTYTEIKERNRRRYFYRVNSVRIGDKIKKERIYLGKNLEKSELLEKEISADKKMRNEKIKKSINEIKKEIIPILKKQNIKKAGLFGSYAKGLQNKKSDIDILIESDKLGFVLVELKEKLSKALKKKIDLVGYNGLSPYLRSQILKEEVRILWEKEMTPYLLNIY